MRLACATSHPGQCSCPLVEEAWFGEGEPILREGLSGTGFYVILDGSRPPDRMYSCALKYEVPARVIQ